MMERHELIQALKELGIAARETRTYIALLERGESNANELHRMTGLTRTKMYPILSQMVVRGLCYERIEGRSRFFSAVDPETILGALRDKWRRENKARESLASEVFSDLANRFKDHDPAEYLESIEVIRNRSQIQKKHLLLMDQTEDCLCAFSRPPFWMSTKSEAEEQLSLIHI